MRIVKLTLDGFRGFPQRQEFDLDADAIVVVGPNGNGKTSLFDGILWGLSGRLPRLANENSNLVSKYSDSGQARVELRLNDTQHGSELIVTRTFDGQSQRIYLETREDRYEENDAESRLRGLLWPDAHVASDPREALAEALTRSVYLQQDLVRLFVVSELEEERFMAFSELMGSGRITQLQHALENQKKAWTGETNRLDEDYHLDRQTLKQMDERLTESTSILTQTELVIAPDEWDRWWLNLLAVGVKVTPVRLESSEALDVVNGAMNQLDGLRRIIQRKLDTIRTLYEEIIEAEAQPMLEVQPLHERRKALIDELDHRKSAVEVEQRHLAEMRGHYALRKERTEQLKALATLALMYLEDRCPVCDQIYDRNATRLRLEAMTAVTGDDDAEVLATDQLSKLLDEMVATEKKVNDIEFSIKSVEQTIEKRRLAGQNLNRQLEELGIAAEDSRSSISNLAMAAAESEASVERMTQLLKVGDSLAQRLAWASSMAVMEELRQRREHLNKQVEIRDRVISIRRETGRLAQDIIEALRDASADLVGARLSSISPILQKIFSRMDTHPTFRVVEFLSKYVRGKGRIFFSLTDPIQSVGCNYPEDILSSSQVNALALSVFLAQNIGVSTPPLSVVMLDDPVQSFDDINLLGLVDLLRQVKRIRQLFVSTHDRHFGGLLARKLRPQNATERTLVIELNGWSRNGPEVTIREAIADPVPLRLAV